VIASWLASPLLSFNGLVPKDSGSRQIARDCPYGTHARQSLDLYAPTGAGPSERLPVILFFYGGSWASGLKEGYAFVGRALAAHGFLAAVADYRLVPEICFPAFVEDGAEAFRWLLANAATHGGDAGGITLMGHSAGAYIAAMLALDPRWLGEERKRVRALVGLSGPYRFHPRSGRAIADAFGRHRPFAATQPLSFAGPGAPPALLLHGGADRTVSPANSRELAARLASAGGEARATIYRDLGHVSIVTALALPFRRQAPVLADAVAFASRAHRSLI
jgi:acetyl esterase/lipase